MKTQFLTDNNGNKLAVLLPIKDYDKIISDLEELDDIRLYDEAMKNDDGTRISLADYEKKRKLKHGRL